MSGALRVERQQRDLYRRMKVSQGGVMLLVRLNADLRSRSIGFIQSMADLSGDADPTEMIEDGSRLRVTFDWLVRQFGLQNAVRAMRETAEEILTEIPLMPRTLR